MKAAFDPLPERTASDEVGFLGSNQSGMRAHNERLVLSLVRQSGALAKSDIARMTGLSAQTVSVIMRSLESDGLLLRGEPVRGKIGQPSVPMSLNADGAYFLGLKIGRRSADLTLIDFLGGVRATRRRIYRYPTPGNVMAFVAGALPDLLQTIPRHQRNRVNGIGVAMPFQLWNWVQVIHAPQEEMDAWRDRDIQAELGDLTGLPVFVRNDASAACAAELVFGTGDRPKDFLYFYFGYFIGGGLVLNGQLFTGRTGNAAGVGPMPVPGPDGAMGRLFDVASMVILADAMEAAGESPDHLWVTPDNWQVSDIILDRWLENAANGLASAILSAATLLELDAVMIDGWMPVTIRAKLVARTERALMQLDLAGVYPPQIRAGTVGAQARALGAASIPLSQRYLLDAGPSIAASTPREGWQDRRNPT